MAAQRVLIVEDDPFTTRSLARLLKSADFEPAVCHTAREALSAVDHTVPDAAIVDVHLPDLNGLVLSQRLRHRFGPDRPIVVLSGDTSMEVVNSLHDAGATYFFSKPVRGDDLLATLRQLVGVMQ